MSGTITYEAWNEQMVAHTLKENRDYLDILKWAYREYGKDIVYACSFGAEGIVLIDLIYKVNKEARVVFLDTGLHFKETYDLIDKMKERYPTLQIDLVKPKMTLQDQTKWYGEELWKVNPNLCCHMRKIVPLQEALTDSLAWITGLRREQSPTRSNVQYINKDGKFQKIKICPLIHWTWDDVMTYIDFHQLEYNPLHDQGYPSIGCEPCTKKVTGKGDARSGRWAGQNKTECGLHLS